MPPVYNEWIVDLPDDLLITVLCRLPPGDVLQFRQVCTRLRDLTSTQYFLDIHLRCTCNTSYPSLILGGLYERQNKKEDEDENENEWAILKCTEVLIDIKLEPFNWKIGKYPENCCSNPRLDGYYYTRCCSHGLAVMKSQRKFIVYNPVYHPEDKVSIFFPESVFERTEAMAVYYHPTLKHYCILWAVIDPHVDPKHHSKNSWILHQQKIVEYKILILGSNPRWRNNIIINNNPWILKCYKYTDQPMVLVDKYLYWLVDHPVEKNNMKSEYHIAIMEFDIISEKLRVVSCPLISVPEMDHGQIVYNTSLLNVCGMLSMFFISHKENLAIYRWTLTDRVEELWTSHIHIHTTILNDYCTKPIAFVDGELLIVSLSHIPRLFTVLHINHGTKRELVEVGDIGFCKLVPLVKSIASLRNCKSEITAEEMDN